MKFIRWLKNHLDIERDWDHATARLNQIYTHLSTPMLDTDVGLAIGRKPGQAEVSKSVKGIGQTTKNTAELLESEDNETALKDLGAAKILHCRIRYFTAGAVIGSKEFVNETFASARDRFGPKRKDGARKLRGDAARASHALWTLRDLRKGIA